MKRYMIAVIMLISIAGMPVTAAAAEKTPQQQKMTVCNQQASSQSLKGDTRRQFMSQCLKKGGAVKSLTAQQQKMKTCNAQAKQKKLAGGDRKTFMSQCLKKA